MRRIVITVIAPAILALSAAGSILAGTAAPAVAAQAPAAHALAAAGSAAPRVYYNG